MAVACLLLLLLLLLLHGGVLTREATDLPQGSDQGDFVSRRHLSPGRHLSPAKIKVKEWLSRGLVYFSGTALAFLVKPSKDAVANGFVTHVVNDAAPSDETRLQEFVHTFEEIDVSVVASADIALPRRPTPMAPSRSALVIIIVQVGYACESAPEKMYEVSTVSFHVFKSFV